MAQCLDQWQFDKLNHWPCWLVDDPLILLSHHWSTPCFTFLQSAWLNKGQLLNLVADHEATSRLITSSAHLHQHTHTANTFCPWERIGLLLERCIIRTALTWSPVHSWAGHTQTQSFPSAASLSLFFWPPFYMAHTHRKNICTYRHSLCLSVAHMHTHKCVLHWTTFIESMLKELEQEIYLHQK